MLTRRVETRGGETASLTVAAARSPNCPVRLSARRHALESFTRTAAAAPARIEKEREPQRTRFSTWFRVTVRESPSLPAHVVFAVAGQRTRRRA
jgi:hypothetical protein